MEELNSVVSEVDTSDVIDALDVDGIAEADSGIPEVAKYGLVGAAGVAVGVLATKLYKKFKEKRDQGKIRLPFQKRKEAEDMADDLPDAIDEDFDDSDIEES